MKTSSAARSTADPGRAPTPITYEDFVLSGVRVNALYLPQPKVEAKADSHA